MASMLFGSAFNVFRIRARKRQGEVARLAGIDASYLAGIECGRRKAPNLGAVNKLLLTLNATESQRRKLRALALIDRMLDVAEGQSADDVPVARVEKLLRQVASFGETEWNSLEWVVSALVHQINQHTEDLV